MKEHVYKEGDVGSETSSSVTPVELAAVIAAVKAKMNTEALENRNEKLNQDRIAEVVAAVKRKSLVEPPASPLPLKAKSDQESATGRQRRGSSTSSPAILPAKVSGVRGFPE